MSVCTDLHAALKPRTAEMLDFVRQLVTVEAGSYDAALVALVGETLGARWKSPVGPINVDVAYGHAVHKYRLHFSLGFTF